MKTKSDIARSIKERFPECENLARAGELEKALDILHILEKEARVANDASSNKQIIIKIAELCVDTRRWEKLCEEIILISKRKGLLKQAFVCLIEAGCEYVNQTPDKTVKLALIQALRQASAGKMQVELHRARLTKQLALIKEADGDIASAADILQELHIENTGVMEPKEKVDFVLEQLRLCLANGDYIKANIVSNRINLKFFEDKTHDDLETRYFHFMTELDLHEKRYFKVCQHYLRLYDVYDRKNEEANALEMLSFCIIFIVLARFEPEQLDLMNRIRKNHEKKIKLLPDVFNYLLKLFTGKELINWSAVCVNQEQVLRSSSYGKIIHQTGVFSDTEPGQLRWKDLCMRAIEFNVRIIASYYTEIKLKRMAELLELNIEEMESILCDLVVHKYVEAKLDRLDGIVSFSHSTKKKESKDVLTELVFNWTKIMNMVENTVHLINREEMASATRVS